MKKLFVSAAALATVGLAAPAFANTTVNIPLQGTLAKRCEISTFLNGPFDALNLESTAKQGAESVTAKCNYGGSATVTFTSANGGALKSGNNSVPYLFHVSGSGPAWDAGFSLASPQSVTGFPAVANAEQSRSMSVTLQQIATIAGTYTDTVTASITPN